MDRLSLLSSSSSCPTEPSGWCSTSAGMGQELARHGPRRYCRRDNHFKLLDLARTNGSLYGWGHGLWRCGSARRVTWLMSFWAFGHDAS
ncbi:hypothetical protein ACFX13_000336 [Malus domestica]